MPLRCLLPVLRCHLNVLQRKRRERDNIPGRMFQESGGSSMKRSCFGVVTISLALLVGGCSDSGGSEPVNGSAVTQEVDTRSFPDSVVLTQNFSTLSPSQQDSIRELHDLSFEEFSARPLETRMLYGAWIRENNAERVLLQVLKQHEVGGRPLLNQTIQPSIDNTAQQIDDQRAEDLAINSYLTDWSDDRQAYNVLESKKFMSLGYLDGSELIDNHDQLLENPSKIGLTVSPCEVTTENVTTPGIVTYSCDKVVTEDGYSSSTISAKWQPFTDIHGAETGNWIITSGQNNR